MSRLPAHPTPAILAAHLRRVADALERPVKVGRNVTTAAERAIELAAVLADHAYPAATLGTGTHGQAEASSTERAAGVLVPDHAKGLVLATDRYAGIDIQFAKVLRLAWSTTLRAESTMAEILKHATDEDHVPGGTGKCAVCDHICQPRKNPHDRLKSLLCPTHYQAWRRWLAQNPMGTHSDFVTACRQRKETAS